MDRTSRWPASRRRSWRRAARAGHRGVKSLLVLSAIAEKEGIDATPRRSRPRSPTSWRATRTSRGCGVPDLAAWPLATCA
jgi:hypothetical protein